MRQSKVNTETKSTKPIPPIARVFSQISPHAGEGKPQPRGDISEFFGHQVLVVLGEPGIGKTTSFRNAANDEPNAKFLRIGEFLSAPQLDDYKGKTLYLDALDEHRSRANGIEVLDAINGRLKQLGCPKVRISCRTAEWHGGQDIAQLKEISRGEAIVQVTLEPLTDSDISELAALNVGFVNGAREHGLVDLLKNPQDFLLLHDFYKERNRWPTTRFELMDGACRALLREPNDAHSEETDDRVKDRALIRASDYLSAILMLSNVTGIAVNRNARSKSYPCIHEFDDELEAMRAAAGRHVFQPIEGGLLEPKHRKISEFMAARYLAARVREGLPIKRAMALLTGFDGGTAADLRGVYAWLVTLLSGMAENVLRHDPYGAIIYGDAYSWTPATKKKALIELKNLSAKDPWFRGHDWSRAALGGMSDPYLEQDFRELLKTGDVRSHLLGAVLDMIAGGAEFPALGDALLDFVTDSQKPDHFRDDAVDAFVTACPGRKRDLVNLLDEIDAGHIEDDHQYVRGAVIRALYPNEISPTEIGRYLIEPSGGVIGSYFMFVRHRIFELSSPTDLRTVAGSLIGQTYDIVESDKFVSKDFRIKLASTLVVELGTSVPIAEVLSWLSFALGRHRVGHWRGDEAAKLKEFLRQNDALYISLFFEYLEQKWTTGTNWHQLWWPFPNLVAHVSPPHEFPKALLERIDVEADLEKRSALFELACQIFMASEPGNTSITIDELHAKATSQREFPEILERASVCDIEEWRQRDAAEKAKELEERRTRQARSIENLEPHRQEIESGKALGFLIHCAQIWWDLFVDVNHEITPRERLIEELGEDLADSIVKGFLAALANQKFNEIAEIAEADIEGKSYTQGYVVLAALDVMFQEWKDKLTNLPNDILKKGIAYSMANAVDEETSWIGWIIDERPELYADAIDEFWRAQLDRAAERVTGLFAFGDDSHFKHVSERVIPALLRDYPSPHPQVLRDLMVNAIRYCDADEILDIVRTSRVSASERDEEQNAIWLSTGFVLNYEEFNTALDAHLCEFEQDRWYARTIIVDTLEVPDGTSGTGPNVAYRAAVIEVLGRYFGNVHHEIGIGSRWVSDQDEPSASDDIRRIVHSLSQDSSHNTTIAISRLMQRDYLEQWRVDLLYTLANQLRAAREAYFSYPDVDQVVATLSNAEPANVMDLKALVVDAITDVANELRHGNTDGYKAFWNTTPRGQVSDIHIDENTARDRLLDLLRPKLRHLDIAAEPEVAYADDKRADIAVYSRGMKLPIEIKRDDHSEIWTAAEKQLEKQYTRDPASEGNGVYLVYWFDGKGMRKPPGDIQVPRSATDLLCALELTIPESSAGLIDVMVVDVSVPDDKKQSVAKRSKSKKKNGKKKTKRKVTKKTNKKIGKKAKKKAKKQAKKKAKKKALRSKTGRSH